MKLDSVVIAGQRPAVNMPLLLAHTARQPSELGLSEGFSLGEFELGFGKEG